MAELVAEVKLSLEIMRQTFSRSASTSSTGPDGRGRYSLDNSYSTTV